MSRPVTRTRPSNKRRQSAVYVKPYRPEELFQPEDMEFLLVAAQHRIVEAFVYFRRVHRGKIQYTDNFIEGVGPRQKQLVEYVAGTLVSHRQGIVATNDLPSELDFRPNFLARIAHELNVRLIEIQINELVREAKLWFNDRTIGIWEIAPSVIDAYNADMATLINVDQLLRRESKHNNGRLEVVHNRNLTAVP